ncbi:MAG: RagB/SusD family nutrient uptake outer membrane protein [Runella sp.]
MKKTFSYLALAGVLTLASCTNLDEQVFGVVPKEGFGSTPEQLSALLGPAYSNLRGYVWHMHNAEVTTDVGLVPTRGKDWYDGGNWLNYNRHTWTTTHGPINDMWGYIYEGGINAINQLIPQVAGNTAAIAELRAVRAFYYFLAMDYFGNIPVITETSTGSVTTTPRAQVYAFIEKELTEALPNLSNNVGGSMYGRINKLVAQTILAKLYLNAGVYKGAPEWQKCIDMCNTVINSGKYKLESNYFANFTTRNEGSTENIWAIPFDRFQAGGMNIAYRTLHYQSQSTFNLSGQPWNGFCTIAEFYDTFASNDVRKNMFIAGLQLGADGKPLKDDNGRDLVFDPKMTKDEMTSADPEFQGAGVRLGKYEIQRNNTVPDQDNDWAMFRLADVYLMRGEALFRLGRATEALPDFNIVRARAGIPAWTAAQLTLDNILTERGRELAWEAWRRNDLVRFGEFNKVGGKFSSKFMREPNPRTLLFPIPQQRRDANPGLTQNPGY